MRWRALGLKGRYSLAQPIGLGAERSGEFHFQGGLKGCDRGELALAAGEWEVSLPFGARGSGVGCGDVTQPCGLG